MLYLIKPWFLWHILPTIEFNTCGNHQWKVITYSVERSFEEQWDTVPYKWHVLSVFQIIQGKYWHKVPIIFPMNKASSLIACFKSPLQFALNFFILQGKDIFSLHWRLKFNLTSYFMKETFKDNAFYVLLDVITSCKFSYWCLLGLPLRLHTN